MSEEQGSRSLADVVQTLEDKAEEDGNLAVGEVLEEFAGRLFGPLIMIPGLAIVSPLGMIPTVPSIMGLFVVLVAGQSLLGKQHPWLPGVLSDRSVEADRFKSKVEKFRPWIKWLDKLTEPRLRVVVTGAMKFGMAAIAILVACTLPPLELLPGAAILPGGTLLLLGLAITAEDGLLGILAIIGALAALGTVVWWFVS